MNSRHHSRTSDAHTHIVPVRGVCFHWCVSMYVLEALVHARGYPLYLIQNFLHTCTHIRACNVCTCAHVCVCVCGYMYVNVAVSVWMTVYGCVSLYAFVHIYVCLDMNTYMYKVHVGVCLCVECVCVWCVHACQKVI